MAYEKKVLWALLTQGDQSLSVHIFLLCSVKRELTFSSQFLEVCHLLLTSLARREGEIDFQPLVQPIPTHIYYFGEETQICLGGEVSCNPVSLRPRGWVLSGACGLCGSVSVGPRGAKILIALGVYLEPLATTWAHLWIKPKCWTFGRHPGQHRLRGECCAANSPHLSLINQILFTVSNPLWTYAVNQPPVLLWKREWGLLGPFCKSVSEHLRCPLSIESSRPATAKTDELLGSLSWNAFFTSEEAKGHAGEMTCLKPWC